MKDQFEFYVHYKLYGESYYVSADTYEDLKLKVMGKAYAPIWHELTVYKRKKGT